MKLSSRIGDKIFTISDLKRQVSRWQLLKKKVVLKNGCFDILHKGHLQLLSEAAALGDFLVVGVNADLSVRKLKGEHRPVNDENFRALMLASLTIVDAVIIFSEDTPLELITEILPDKIVKGGDYHIEQVVGAEIVLKNGGDVVIVPLVEGYSTTGLIAKIREL